VSFPQINGEIDLVHATVVAAGDAHIGDDPLDGLVAELSQHDDVDALQVAPLAPELVHLE